MHNGEVYEANIKDIDKKSDIATIKINPQVSQGSQAAFCSHDSLKASGQQLGRNWETETIDVVGNSLQNILVFS